MSRRGTPRDATQVAPFGDQIQFVKGNVLEPETFKDVIQDVDGVVHTVGTLIENKKNP